MKNKLKVLLLDTINPVAEEKLREAGYDVETFSSSTPQSEISKMLRYAVILGIRSQPKIPFEILKDAPNLLAVGCFNVGFDHVNVSQLAQYGIPVFNAGSTSSKSVAELVIAFTYSLLRRVHEHNMSMHKGLWSKTSSLSHEVSGKVIGIIGFGNIGKQVAMLAEANGMRVLFFDIEDIPKIGNIKKASSLKEVLESSDIITVHVPGNSIQKPLIGMKEISLMKKGAVVINTSRPSVVNYKELLKAIQNGRLGGAAIDVFQDEPLANGRFISELVKSEKIILTPHIGSSTEETQSKVAKFVSEKLINYVLLGSTVGALNIPNLRSGMKPSNIQRITYMYCNYIEAVNELHELTKKIGVKIIDETFKAHDKVGYAILDVLGNIKKEEIQFSLATKLQYKIKIRVL